MWVGCCCGCLPWIAVIKGFLAAPPCIILTAVPMFIICILYIPHDIIYTLFTILNTPRLGPNIKTLAMLILPIALLLWPPHVLLCGIMMGLYRAFSETMMRSFDENASLCGGITEALSESLKIVKDFWQFMSDSYFSYLEDFRAPLNSHEAAFDISLSQICIGFGISLVGICIDGVLISFCASAKFIPMILRTYYNLWKRWIKALKEDLCMGLMFGLPFIVANMLVPVAATVVYGLCAIGGIFVGIYTAAEAHESGIVNAFRLMFHMAYKFDDFTSSLLFDDKNMSFIVYPCFQDMERKCTSPSEIRPAAAPSKKKTEIVDIEQGKKLPQNPPDCEMFVEEVQESETTGTHVHQISGKSVEHCGGDDIDVT